MMQINIFTGGGEAEGGVGVGDHCALLAVLTLLGMMDAASAVA